MKVINLWAGPGAGKSTTAAGLFFLMKLRGINVELVTEYAKDMTYDFRVRTLKDQQYIVAKQHSRQLRLRDHVDFVITDSPLLIALAYAPPNYYATFEQFVTEVYDSYDNVNVWINRVKPYVGVGRSQTEAEARELDVKLSSILGTRSYFSVDGNPEAPKEILRELEDRKIL